MISVFITIASEKTLTKRGDQLIAKKWIGTAIVVVVAIASLSSWYLLSPQPTQPEQKIFQFAITGEDLAASIDPCIASTTHETYSMVNIYDPLFMPDPDQDNKPIPWVAESYSFSTDGLKCTIKIRQGLKFHDGTEVTADDIAFTMDRYLYIKKGWSQFWTPIINVGTTKAIDKYTVEFNLKAAYASFIPSLTLLWVQNKDLILQHKKPGNFSEYGDAGKDWLSQENQMDVGSGPYKLVWYDSYEWMDLVAFEDYWKGWNPNQFKKIRIVPIREQSTIKFAIARGDIGMTDDWMSPKSYEELNQTQNVRVVSTAAAGVAGIFAINTQKAPTDDVHVRRAISYCIDYNAAVSQIYGGTQARGIVPPTVPGFDSNIQPLKQNITRALEELSMSKYSKEELASMEIDVRYLGDQEYDERFCTLFQSNAAAIGLNLRVSSWTFSMLVQAVNSPETTPNIFCGRTFARFPDAEYFVLFFHSTNLHTWSGGHFWQSAENDQLLNAIKSELDPAKRQALLNQMQEKVVQELPVLFIANPGTSVAMRDNIEGYHYTTDGYQFWLYRLAYKQ
jgi:peptide/nickel transport system substrate-binding protein